MYFVDYEKTFGTEEIANVLKAISKQYVKTKEDIHNSPQPLFRN